MKKKQTTPRDEKPKRIRRRNRFLPTAIGPIGGVILAGVAFYFFAEQAERVVEGRADDVDEKIMEAVHQLGSPGMGRAMRAITQLGTHAAVGSAAGIAALVLARRGRKDDAWTIVLSTAGAIALNTALKAIFQRQRPQERAREVRLPSTHSFPSGHSLLSSSTYPILAHLLVQKRNTRVIVWTQGAAALVILLVGSSRVYLGVHFPSDVLGGYAAGLGWLGLTALTHSIVDERRALVDSAKASA